MRRLTTHLTRSLILTALGVSLLVNANSCGISPLEGDWFFCENAACTELGDEGVRFTADDRWGVLDAPGGSYEPGEPVELERERGRYSFDGSTITLTLDGSSERESVQVAFEDDDTVVIQVTIREGVCEPSPAVPGETPAPPKCYETEREEKVRLRRVGPAGEVPVSDSPLADDPPPSTDVPSPTPAP